MTQEQIEKAARESSTRAGYNIKIAADVAGRTVYECAFEAGAQWRINSVWHDMEEKPNFRGLPILLEHKKGQIHFLDETPSNWNYVIKYYIRWAYVVDLLPADSE